MFDNLLIYRLMIVNLCGAVIVIWLWQRGIISLLFLDDRSHITFVILGFFLIGIYSVFVRGAKLSAHLNRLKRHERVVFNVAKFSAKSEHIGDIMTWCVLLGLLGTSYGVRIATAGADFSSQAAVQKFLTNIFIGFSVANGPTIVGITSCLWLAINWRMLSTAITLAAEHGK